LTSPNHTAPSQLEEVFLRAPLPSTLGASIPQRSYSGTKNLRQFFDSPPPSSHISEHRVVVAAWTPPNNPSLHLLYSPPESNVPDPRAPRQDYTYAMSRLVELYFIALLTGPPRRISTFPAPLLRVFCKPQCHHQLSPVSPLLDKESGRRKRRGRGTLVTRYFAQVRDLGPCFAVTSHTLCNLSHRQSLIRR